MGSWLMARPGLESRKWMRHSPWFPDVETQHQAQYIRHLAYLHDNLFDVQSRYHWNTLETLHLIPPSKIVKVEYPRMRRPEELPALQEFARFLDVSGKRISKSKENVKPLFLHGQQIHVTPANERIYNSFSKRHRIEYKLPQGMRLVKPSEPRRMEDRFNSRRWFSGYGKNLVQLTPNSYKMFLLPHANTMSVQEDKDSIDSKY